MTPWTNEPDEKDHNQPSRTSTRSRSILSWPINALSGSLRRGNTREKCWTSLSLKHSFPIRLSRNVFMLQRNLKENWDSATFLNTSPRYTLNCNFFIAMWMSLRRTVTWQLSGLCGVHAGVSIEVLSTFSSMPKQSIFKLARRYSRIDAAIIGLNSSCSTFTRTTFSVAEITCDCSSSITSISSWRALLLRNKTVLNLQRRYLSFKIWKSKRHNLVTENLF